MEMSVLNSIRAKVKYYRGRIRFHLPESMYLKITYFERTGQRLNLRNPVTFNDKINWLKLNYRPELYVQLADKYRVRDYVTQRIGQKYLIPLLGVYNNADEIEPATLPDQFVLKPNHGSGWVIRCTDKATLNWADARRKLTQWLATDHTIMGKEWQYGPIPRKIVCEKFIFDDLGRPPTGYKLFCTDGQPHFCQIDNLMIPGHKRYHYDVNWQKLPIHVKTPSATDELPKPELWDEMLMVASKPSAGLPFCRVDLYIPGKQIYFGEMTLTPAAGYDCFEPAIFNTTLGEKIKLPKPYRNSMV